MPHDENTSTFGWICALLSSPARAQSWAEYGNEEGNFHVQIPGTPALNTAQIPVGNNEAAAMTEAVVRAPGAAYQVSYIVYPPRIAGTASADVILDTFRNNMSAGRGCRNETTLMPAAFRAAHSPAPNRLAATRRCASPGVAASNKT